MVGPTRFSGLRDNNKDIDNKPVKRIPNKLNRLEFDVDNQVQFVHDRGIKVLWEQSYICTCLSKMTKSPQPDCPICNGRGIAYLPAVNKVLILQSQDRSVSNTDLGLIESGTATATTVPDSPVTFRDRISVPDVSIRQSMIINVTQERIDTGFRLPYDVNRVLLARTEDGIALEEVKDYDLNLAENIFTPNAKYLGKNISLNIDTILRYIVVDLLKESRYQYSNKGTELEEFVNLPKKLLLRREDAWINPIAISIEDSYATPEDADEPQWDDPKRDMSGGGFFGGSYDG